MELWDILDFVVWRKIWRTRVYAHIWIERSLRVDRGRKRGLFDLTVHKMHYKGTVASVRPGNKTGHHCKRKNCTMNVDNDGGGHQIRLGKNPLGRSRDQWVKVASNIKTEYSAEKDNKYISPFIRCFSHKRGKRRILAHQDSTTKFGHSFVHFLCLRSFVSPSCLPCISFMSCMSTLLPKI